MRRKLTFTFAFLALAGYLSAQALLPTSWTFSGSAPTGWTLNGMAYYTGSGNTIPAGKFDGTGDFLMINYANSAGPLSYYLAGNSFSGGTFTVEESTNGTTWTALRTFTSPPAGTYTLFTDNPASTSRYIRFIYTNKVSGNIGVDDISLAAAPAGPQQEINVMQGTTTILNGGQHAFNSPVATPVNVTFTIENLGTFNALNIISANVTGAAASDYSVTTTPTSVAANSSASLVISFNPTAAGTRAATLTITNDDSDENPYIIELYGVGGNYASEPTTSPTNLTFTNVKSYRFTASFTSSAADGFLILRRTGTTVTDQPVDGTEYTRGDAIGNSKVVYVGPLTTFVPNNIIADTTYYFSVFPYNGPDQFINYFQSAPLTGSVTTAGNMMGNYYTGISTSSATFVSDLSALINPHTRIFYSNFGPTMVDLFSSRDTTNGQKVVTCVYSGFNYVYTTPFDWSVMSREHTYAHSWMPTNPAQNFPEYDDQHNLFPTLFSSVNQVRSNYPFGEVVNVTQQYLEGKLGTDYLGQTVYEPRESHKGDAARAVMYMATAYDGVNDWSIPANQNQDVLKNWHWQDLPDSWEIARNDFLDSLQGNRNPFVDSVNFACYIDFSSMTKIASPTLPCVSTTGVEEITATTLNIYPNPASGSIILTGKGIEGSANLTVSDIAGKTVKKQTISFTDGMSINVSDLEKGIYIIRISQEAKVTRGKFVKE